MGTREQMVSRIWDSTDLWSDLAELCAFGGRFCGTPSETRAREYLRERLAAATGAPVTGRRIDTRTAAKAYAGNFAATFGVELDWVPDLRGRAVRN